MRRILSSLTGLAAGSRTKPSGKPPGYCRWPSRAGTERGPARRHGKRVHGEEARSKLDLTNPSLRLNEFASQARRECCLKEERLPPRTWTRPFRSQRMGGRGERAWAKFGACDPWTFRGLATNWRSNGMTAARVSSRWRSSGAGVPARVAKARWTSWATFARGRTSRCRQMPLSWRGSRPWAPTPSSRSGPTATTRGFYSFDYLRRVAGGG